MNDSEPSSVLPPQPSRLKEAVKAMARFAALLAVSPVLLCFWTGSLFLGRNRALESATQLLALAPGISGQYLRRAFLQRALAGCHHTVLVEFGTIFSQSGARLDANAYIGPWCVLGLVHLERDVLLGPGVQVPSGAMTHYFDDPDKPIREQGGARTVVTIGEGAWLGAGAIVLADVGKGTIVGAGSVVTKPLPENIIAAGVPAKVIRSRNPVSRDPESSEGSAERAAR